MNLFFIVLSVACSMLTTYAQGNRVFSGGEFSNNNIVDISPVNGIAWSTERAALPGYFSVIDTATYIGCSDSENINGYIKKYGNKPFIFPVGSGNDLRTLEISAPLATTDAYATAWIVGNPSLNLDPTAPFAGPHSVYSGSAPIVAVSTAGQWDWQVGEAGTLGAGTTGSGAGLTITVSIPDMTSFAQALYLRLVGWNGTRWIDLSNAATASGNTENSTLRGTMVAGITAIAVGRVEPSLSFKLEHFTAASLNCNALLEWQTSGESNIDNFIVEHSKDGVHFNAIASTIALGLPTGSNYSITVAQASREAYYRLKMVASDGSFTYSEIISNSNNCTSSDYMLVYPNPVSAFEKIYLSFATSYQGKADFILFNSTGQSVMTIPIEVLPGPNLLSVDVKNLAAGTYFIIVLSTDGNQIGVRQKFIRQ